MNAQRQFVMFALIGCLNTALHFIVFLLFFRGGILPMLLASTVGYCAGLVNSYFLNRRFTFKVEPGSGGSEFVRFVVVNLIALLLNLAVLQFLTSVYAVWPEIAQLVAIGASLVFNFTGNKYWTFGRTSRQQRNDAESLRD